MSIGIRYCATHKCSFAKSFSSSTGPLQQRKNEDTGLSDLLSPGLVPATTSTSSAVGTTAIKTSSSQSDPPVDRALFPEEHLPTRIMASDEDYAAFLDKANQDPNEGIAKSTGKKGKVEFTTVSSGLKVPEVLTTATKDAFYMSDSDEEFVPVCLKMANGKKGLPDEGELIIKIFPCHLSKCI